MFRAFVHILTTLVVGAGAFYLYETVLPKHPAMALAAVLAGLELLSPIFSKNRGLSLRLIVKLALPLLAWPILAAVLEYGLQMQWATGMAFAAVGAVAIGFLSAGHGSGRESLRLAGAGVATLIALYAMITSIVTGAPILAMVAASLSVGEAALVVYQAGVWPGGHERALLRSAGACGCVAGAWGVLALITLM